MEANEKLLMYDYIIELLKETTKLRKEIERLRSKLDSRLFQIGQKFSIVNNDLLLTKNKYKGTQRSFQAKPLYTTLDKPITIHFD
tara:strand:- start:2130 stop:2384 length:255 start_codon:yes stop_codon:yes gene_type:complete